MQRVTSSLEEVSLKQLFLIPFLIAAGLGNTHSQADEVPWAELRASDLNRGYAIKILKPIPRHNNGCDTVFRNGKALETCDGNFGLNPEIYGGALTFCKWNLYTVYDPRHPDDEKKWIAPFSAQETIKIKNATDLWKVENVRETIYGRIRKIETIKDRHIRIQFNHPELGELTCYSGYLKQFRENSSYYFGATYFKWKEARNEGVYSGLSIVDIQRSLGSYVRIVPLQE